MDTAKMTRQERIRVVKQVTENGLTIGEVAKKEGIHRNTISLWLRNKRYNLDEEYVRLKEERSSKMHATKKPRDPFPEGVLMAAKNNPEELARENRDLRRKISYLEDKVAYLETLYSILKEAPEMVPKKKESKPSQDLSGRADAMSDESAQ